MIFKKKHLLLILITALLIGGCSGVRHSYESLLDKSTSPPTIYMSVGEKKEVLAMGGGFPGWWGFYPAMLTLSPSIASVDCKQTRSFIPFREPGVIFGGTVCYLTAHKAGETLAQYGNKYNLETEMAETKLTDHDQWIKVIVKEKPNKGI